MDDGAIINDAGKHNVNRGEFVTLNGPARPGDHCLGCDVEAAGVAHGWHARFETVAGMETEN